MAILQFDVVSFRAQFPGLFPDPPNTDSFINVLWDAAICYVSPQTGGFLSDDCLRQVLNLVTAHLIALIESSQAGNQAGFIVSGSIDNISVTISAPSSKSGYQFFLNQTQFGIQAYSMLYAAGVGGFFYGGFNELGSFRRAGGVFIPPLAVVEDTAPEISTCPILTVPPTDLTGLVDYGTIISGNPAVAMGLEFPVDCTSLILGWSTLGPGENVRAFIFSGFSTDTGDRFNIYYWSSDDRVAGNQPTLLIFNADVTGENFLAGVITGDLVSGTVVNEPNIMVITGVDNEDTIMCNVNMTI